MEKPLIAITVHKVPHKEFCGVVILRQEGDRSWNGRCSKCGEDFRIEEDSKFRAHVLAMRN
ncbi:MAG: hypothetical protein V3R69_02290 [candidate division NC10 bacterium]|jgi:hypothetical protein|nr:hypothetical protein [candidate division NC10 bacterium]MCZ6551619.1 hypothetical protein [candidate division NC10 bacterium]